MAPISEDSNVLGETDLQARPGIGKRRVFAIKNLAATAEYVRGNCEVSQFDGITEDHVGGQLMQNRIIGCAFKPIRIHADAKVAGEEVAYSHSAATLVVKIAMIATPDGVIVGIREIERKLLILEKCA